MTFVCSLLEREVSSLIKVGHVELISEYGLFLAKIITVITAIVVAFTLVTNLTHRKKQRGELRTVKLGEQYREIKEEMFAALLNDRQKKLWKKTKRKKLKKEEKTEKAKLKRRSNQDDDIKSRVFVIDFKGSVDANEVASLREEITVILAVAKSKDQVVLRLESLGGVIHGYGLAASQLQRLREKQVHLTIVVDKVAASGGYMMACVANKIVAAPFSIIGSIGVVAQIPNFNRFLKSKEIDIELHTAGQYKRTLTVLGENTEEGRKKFQEDLNEAHYLFKDFVKRMRPSLDIEQVATGEYWYGIQALEKGLVDEIGTSDDLLLSLMKDNELIGVRFIRHKKRILDRFITTNVSNIFNKILQLFLIETRRF